MNHILDKGYIQIYTGDGKGKSTAAFGVAARMAGHGGRVFIGRFMKGLTSGENLLAESIGGIEHEDFGSGEYILGEPSGSDIDAARYGLKRIENALESGDYDLVIADELCDALSFGLLKLDDVMDAIEKKHERTELIITGRDVDGRLTAMADLVTEMRPVKHYFDKGVSARRGIEY